MPASERFNIWKTTVYSVLLILAIWPLCHGRQVYHVTPNEGTNCHNATTSCHTLDYYAKELNEDSHYFPQETVLYFHPGIHNLAGNISIASLAELVLHGSDTASSSRMVPVEIVCTSKGEAGFLLQHVNNLVIANLTFTSCGLMYRNTIAAIHIRFVTNLTISHTVIQNSTGYGVRAVIGEPGKIVVTNSQFIYNGWHTDQRGGHMIIGNSYCSARSGINLSIRSSMFLYGKTSTIYPPGLIIILEYPCYPFNIHIGDSLFIGNGEYQSTTGGHLFLQILYSSLNRVNGSTIMITDSQFINGTAQQYGGAAYIDIREKISAYPCNEYPFLAQIHFAVLNTLFHGNKAQIGGGGLYIYTEEACHGHHTFELNNVTFSNNTANLAAHMLVGKHLPAMHPHAIVIRNCTFANGEATVGNSLVIISYRVYYLAGTIEKYSPSSFTCVEICHSKFINNKGVIGGGVYIRTDTYVAPRSTCIIDICNSSFISNAAPALSVDLGKSITVAELYVFRFTNLDFRHNYSPLAQSSHYMNASTQDPDSKLINDVIQTIASNVLWLTKWSTPPTAILLTNVKNATFFNCKVNDNNCTGLVAEYSTLFFEGSSTFRGNLGTVGGGMSLKDSSIMLNSKVQLYFISNHARFGGAIYVSSKPRGENCFFQPNTK